MGRKVRMQGWFRSTGRAERDGAARVALRSAALHRGGDGAPPARIWHRSLGIALVVFAAALAIPPAASCATTPSPTPSFTPTPRVVEIPGRIFDASVGPNSGIAGASVEYAQQGVTASLLTDDQGEFAFTLTVPDSQDLIVRASAVGFAPELRSIRAGDLRDSGRLDIGLLPSATPLATFVYGRVYDASMGTDAV